MSGLNQKIEETLAKSPSSSWKDKVEWRRVNKDWLRKSSAIAFRILDALDDMGWKQARLAKELGVSAQQVSKYVKGEENFKLETLCKLEKALGIELVTVLQADEEISQKTLVEYREDEARIVNLKLDYFSHYMEETKSARKCSYLTAV